MITLTKQQKIDLPLLLKLADQCQGEVILESELGDRLDLKSGLSQYVFAVLLHNMEPDKKYWLQCGQEADEEILIQAIE